MAATPTRRAALRLALGAGCSAAAWPIATPVLIAETPGEARLVVILLRGALDGLAALPPHGDRHLRSLRPGLAEAEPVDLDGFFGLGAPFAPLLPYWQAGTLGAIHAVATPYRGRRSHFDGQDLLETGGSDPEGAVTPEHGWLNRALARLPGARAETAIAIGRERLTILDGPAARQAWSPAASLDLAEDERALLSHLYTGDPLFSRAFARASALGGETAAARETGAVLGAYAAERLKGSARIAAFSLGGWDTHRAQNNAIVRPARQLAAALDALSRGLGPDWSRTAVLCLTEFGRTARENGSRGTDHGTGGVLLYAGGALRGGRVLTAGRWPGLHDGALLEERDLRPTLDLRAPCAWALRGLFGLSASAVEQAIFPGLDLGDAPDPGLLA